ncbi:MAG: bifunctional proline dehydrogenase/L-glutamate gamma-semialdehyde dehydrogenase PutA [Pseudomonadota bacterium]
MMENTLSTQSALAQPAAAPTPVISQGTPAPRRVVQDFYVRPEADVLDLAITLAQLSAADQGAIAASAAALVAQIRKQSTSPALVDALLQEYGLSAAEGVALMRLSEALIRTPDFDTARLLIRDKLGAADWAGHAGQSPHLLVNQATNSLRLSAAWVRASGGAAGANLLARLGDKVLASAIEAAMGVMARHFVLGRTIEEAVAHAPDQLGTQTLYSYDMLGEAALTAADAARYFEAYKMAAEHIASNCRATGSAACAPSISVKLSALHPRYELAKADLCVPALTARLLDLASIAKAAGFGLTIDAEEVDRLEISLDIFKALLDAPELAGWDGLGIVVQAYQRRAVPVIEWLVTQARAADRSICVRLVKGAYWDSEVKRAQDLGLESYPVFTRKENTDVNYLACARLLLDAPDCLYPQFATHNAQTAAAVLHMAGTSVALSNRLEFQRLHGMGKEMHDVLCASQGVTSRIYAPVGQHKDLLPYLVRRLLENGANSSFVNQLLDPQTPIETLIADPIAKAQAHEMAANPKLPSPRDQFGGERLLAAGADLTQQHIADAKQAMLADHALYKASSIIAGQDAGSVLRPVVNPANPAQQVGVYRAITGADVAQAAVSAEQSSWPTLSAAARAQCLAKAADLLEGNADPFLRLCVLEAGKTLPDAVAEVREAIDFCRYYAREAQQEIMTRRPPLGVVACISPWNFPLAIFLGQVVAALSVGNTVLAKPAPQTPLIAHMAVRLLHSADVPVDAVQLLLGDGVEIGTAMTRDPQVAGVCFTGSTATAKQIAKTLANTGRARIPFIAETGGVNAMIIDSTALIEQAVKDVIASAFRSAGQRCSACRLVCVQADVADDFIAMLSGAMEALSLGDPARLANDIGPVIDAAAAQMINGYVAEAQTQFKAIGPNVARQGDTQFVAPAAFEINQIGDLKREVFGPVLHVYRFNSGGLDTVIDEINALGYGLTMGLHTRLDARVAHVACKAKVGNLYVNRNQIGAVVGVQPFGGEGLSGTGPKAGGPHYLYHLTQNTVLRPAVKAEAPATHRAIAEAFGVAVEDLPNAAVDREIVLPGPTGEKNTLTLHPRGTLLSFGGDDAVQLAGQLALTLAAGNRVRVVDSTQRFRHAAQDLAATLPKGMLDIVSYAAAMQMLEGHVDGVLCDGAQVDGIANRLAMREGAIVPLLSTCDIPQRFYHERTVSVNTTAAGGNASLLAMT